MKPRGFLLTFLRLAILMAAFFGISFSLAMSLVERGSFVEVLWPAGAILGGVFGVLAASIAAPGLRPISRTLTTAIDERFVLAVTLALVEWDYHPEVVSSAILTFAKPGLPGFVGKITIVCRQKDATVVGPARFVRALISTLGVREN